MRPSAFAAALLCTFTLVNAEAASVLLVQDAPPWSLASNEAVLDGLGVAYDTVTAAGLSEVKLANYQTVIVASVQTQEFYDALAPYAPKIERWLRSGRRTLEFHGATYSFGGQWNFALPRGVTGYTEMQRTGIVSDFSSPLAAGLPADLRGNYASHISLLPGKVDPARVVTETLTAHPTTLDYCHGSGRVMVTGMAVEFAYERQLNFAPLLTNMLTASTTTPGCPR